MFDGVEIADTTFDGNATKGLYFEQGSNMDLHGLSVQADELGRFVLDGLRAGVVRLHVVLRGTQIAIPWTTI